MAKIIGYVKSVSGVFKAESKDGVVRTLNPNDPIYEDDAVFGGGDSDQSINADLNYINISLNDGEEISLTGEDYQLFDSSVLGNEFVFSPFEVGKTVLPQNDDGQDKAEDQPSSDEAIIFTDNGDSEGITEFAGPDSLPEPMTSQVDSPVEQNQDLAVSPVGEDIIFEPQVILQQSPPVATSDNAGITENSNDAVTGNVISNDSDANGDILSVTAVDNETSAVAQLHAGNYGTVTINGDGSYSYQLDNSHPDVQQLHDGDSLTDTFSYTVDDGHGGSDTATLTVTINGSNDLPTIDLDTDNSTTDDNNYQTTFTENGSAVAIADIDSSITDVDDTNMESATIVLTNAQAGDSLDTSNVDSSFNATIDTGVAGKITVTLSGSHSNADYADAIGSITFTNGSEDPVGGNRTIEVTTNDGSDDSNVAISTITVVPVNDVPTATNVSSGGDKDDSYIPITLAGSDVDSDISHFRITESPAEGTLYTDEALTHQVVINQDIAATENSLVLYFKPDYGADSSTTYGPDHYNPTGDDVTFTYQAKDSDPSDGVTYSNSATAIITVDDVPYAAEADDKSVVENYAGSTLRNVSGNVITDGDDFDSGIDYQSDHGDNPAFVQMIQIADASGNYGAPVAINTGTDEGGGDYSFDTDLGTLVINADGEYTFTPDSSIYNSDGADADFKFSYAIQDTDGDLSNYAEQVIHIQDGEAPDIYNTTDVTLYEKNLSRGTEPDDTATTQSGNIDATAGTDAMDIVFDTTQSDLDTKIVNGLSSGGDSVSYIVSDDGHTLTGVAGGDDIFTVSITDPTTDSASYEFHLVNPLDHETDVVNDSGDIDFTFSVTAGDADDHDSDSDTFDVIVVDDTPADQSITTDEETAHTFNTNADATGGNTVIYDGENGQPDNTPSYGEAVVNADGTITYTPTPGDNYSGSDTFIYTTTLDDGTVTDTTVTVTVNPVADMPTWDADKTGSSELSTDEDALLALNLTLPHITDDIDRDGGTGAGDDEPEHLGLITLAGVPEGTKIYLSDGTTLKWESTVDNNGTAKIRIDDDTSTWSASDLHYDGISGEDILLTPTEFEGLKLLPPEDSGSNISNITLSVQSYEVDVSGSPLGGVSPSAAATQHIDVDVQAVTDDFTLSNIGDASGTEDGWIRIDNTISIDSATDSSDGSEQFTLKITADDLPSGTMYRVDGGDAYDASSGININNFILGTTEIEILPPANDSSDINGLTIELERVDSDVDSGGVINPVTHSIDIDVNVAPVANDLTVSGGGSGNEDSQIPMGIAFGGSDGNEEVEYVTIAGVPDGAKIYAADGTLLFTGDGTSDFIVDVTAVDPAGETCNDTLDNISDYKILPPQDSNTDISLNITIHTRDYDDDTSSTSVTGSYSETINIQVAGVVDTSVGDQDTADTGHLYVELGTSDGNAVSGDDTVTDFGHIAEDTAIDLHANWQSYEAITNATADGSEEATFIIRNVTDNTGFTVVDGSGNVIGSQTSDGWELNTSQLADAHVLAQDNFSGELNLELVTTVTESGDDLSFDVNTQVDKFKVTIDSATDSPYLQVRDVFTQEDNAVQLDIRPVSVDTDGSESLKTVKIENIPDGVALKLSDGTTVWLNDSGDISECTFTINDSSTSIGARASDGTTALNITESSLYDLLFTPPAHASGDIDLQVTSTLQDGTADSVSATQTLTVHVQGVADPSVLELEDIATDDVATGVRINGNDIGDGGTSTYNDGDTVVVYGQERTSDSDGAIPIAVPNASGETVVIDVATDMDYSHAAYDGDISETLSFVLEGVPDDFRIVDANGDTIGNFITLSGGTSTWALTASEVENGVYLKAPVDYSGIVDGLKYTCIVTEADGHSTSRELPFSLEVNPVISTTDPIQDASGSEDAAPDGTAHGTLIDLDFSHVADSTGSEVVTHVSINDADIPAGLELYVQDGDSWVRADSLSAVYDGTTYDLSNYADKTAVGVVGDTLENVAGTFTISNVQVTVTDGDENGNSTDVTTTFTDSLDITLEGVADAPSVSVADVSGDGQAHDLDITITYPDDDGSEQHYITIDTPGDDYQFNHGEQVTSSQWLFSPDDMDGLQVLVPDGSSSDFTVTAYAVENGTETASTTFTVTDTANSGTGDDGTHSAQDPVLTVSSGTLSPDEDTTFTLADVIDSDNTHLNDTDGGSEVLSFVVSDLPQGALIESSDSALVIDEIIDSDGSSTYTFTVVAGMTVSDALGSVQVTPPTDFSGDMYFTVKAVATETADTFYDSSITGSDNNVHVAVQPVADQFTLDASAMDTDIVEDSKTQVKFELESTDSYSDGNDQTEQIYLDSLATDEVQISTASGSFIDSSGNELGDGETLDVRVSGGIVQYDTTGSGNWVDVYFKAPAQGSGRYDITVTANSHDTTEFDSGSTTTATSAEQTQTITVTVTPDPEAADAIGDPNGGLDEFEAVDVATTEDTAVKLDITVTTADNDGSELHAFVITNLPDGSLLQDGTGALVGTNNGDGSWTVEQDDLANLYLLPPQNYSGTMNLTVENRVVEIDDMSEQSTSSVDFTVTVDPVADGAIITPHNSSGNEDEYIAIDLEVASIEAEQNASSAIDDTPQGDEHYQLTFDGIHESVQFFWKDGDGIFQHLDDENSGESTDYLISNLTQDQVDNLYAVIGDNLTGTFEYGVHVATQEVDSSNNVVDTSATEDSTISITANAVVGDDTLIGTDDAETIYGHSGDDTIDGGGGADTIYAGSGDDTITFDSADTIDGGTGTDTLILSSGSSITFDGTATARLDNIEQLDLSQNGDHTLDSLSINDLIDITDDNNELTILGDAGDNVNLQNGDGGEWVATGTVEEGGHTFDVYDLSTDADMLTLKVEDTINLQIV